MSYQVVEVRMTESLDQVEALMREHWTEMVLLPDAMPMKLDMARYQALEAAGALVCLAIKDSDVIVGYSVSILTVHPHHAEVPMLVNDSLFLSKEHRRGRAGLQLIAETERLAKLRGATLITWNAELDTPLSRLLPQLGYQPMNTVFGKEV